MKEADSTPSKIPKDQCTTRAASDLSSACQETLKHWLVHPRGAPHVLVAGKERDHAATARNAVPCCDEFLLLEIVDVPGNCNQFHAHHRSSARALHDLFDGNKRDFGNKMDLTDITPQKSVASSPLDTV